MTPTNKLRFVEREVPCGDGYSKTIRVLQQWWEAERPDGMYYGEWRDVPLEEEE
jgi:hypothetical protein